MARPSHRVERDPSVVSDPPAGAPVVEEETVDQPAGQRFVRAITGIIQLVCAVFALIHALHIVLVAAGANPNNSFASFVDTWAGNLSLGLRGLFTPDNAKLQVLLNHGLAAILWLIIGAVIAYTIRWIALAGTRTAVRYRRRVR